MAHEHARKFEIIKGRKIRNRIFACQDNTHLRGVCQRYILDYAS